MGVAKHVALHVLKPATIFKSLIAIAAIHTAGLAATASATRDVYNYRMLSKLENVCVVNVRVKDNFTWYEPCFLKHEPIKCVLWNVVESRRTLQGQRYTSIWCVEFALEKPLRRVR
jgi:hypothetical protein